MSYLALARKWRPKVFSEVIGQEHVVSALSNALNNQRVHHAFLFTGTRGVGKTTLARIFAKALNCESGVSAEPCGECIACQGVDQGNFIDLIEVDAASRTKVDDTRELLDNVQYTPTMGRFKIYLIDEVHMLSSHSFNALLKTLEEPPEHVKFLLATTNPQKLPATILSRCIQFNLKAVDIGRLTGQLEKILDAENIKFDTAALMVLARSANGSVRDALSLLDQAIAFSNGDISTDHVRSMLGMIDDRLIVQLLEQVIENDSVAVLESVSQMAERSADYASALDELLTLIHNLSLFQVSPQSVEWKGIDTSALTELGERIEPESLQLLYQIAVLGKRDFDYAPDPRSGFEMVLIRMLAFQPRKIDASGSNPGGNATDTKPTIAKTENKSSVEAKSIEAKPAEQKLHVVTKTAVAPGDSDGDGDGDQNQTDTQAPPARNHSVTNIDLDKLLVADGWQQFIEDSEMVGISRELLMNMIPQSIEENVLNLTLDSASRQMFNNDRLRKIEGYCKNKLSLDLKLNVVIDDLSDGNSKLETPTQKNGREQKEREANARQAFIHDSNVQALVDTFDAEIVNETIKPAS